LAKIDRVTVNFYYFIDYIIFLSQLTLFVCVWRWSCDLSRGSRCKSRWERRCI